MKCGWPAATNMNARFIIIAIGVVVTAAATEYCVLRRSYNRWSLLELICRGATVNGGVWTLCSFTIIRLMWGVSFEGEFQSPAQPWSFWGFAALLLAAVFTTVGLIPAAIVAAVYHRSRKA